MEPMLRNKEAWRRKVINIRTFSMFDRAAIMAQCSWHCNYKDFPQHLIRWWFHAPASVIRLTQADFLYVNQVFIRLFPPEKISLLHANAPVLPRHTAAGWYAGRSVGLQPEPHTAQGPSIYWSLGAVYPLWGGTNAWKQACRARLSYSSESWTCFWGIIPPCEQQCDEKSLWASYRNVTHKCVITC